LFTIHLRQHLFACSALAGALVVSAAPALAQDAEVAEVVVTGSRIQRPPNLVAPTPIQVVDQAKLQSQGLENVADILETLPQFAPSFGTSRTQSTFSGTADSGLNLVNLRNLGDERSLVLINGRRAPSGAISTNAVDLNLLPSVNIKRIDVITGGASAVYGADAVSGVVNIITDTAFKGVEVGLSYGEALRHNDNQNPSAYIRVGVGDDRVHAGATLQYDYQGLVRCADRYLCAEDFAWFPPDAPVRGPAARSGVPLGGRFFPDDSATGYTFNNGALVPFSTSLYGYNRNAARTLAIPTKRILFAGDAEAKITDGIEAFLEVNYAYAKTRGPFEAHPFQSGTDFTSTGLEPTIPTSNPFLPASLSALATAGGVDEIPWWQRFEGLSARGSENRREFVRAAAGLRGDFDSIAGFGKDWSYELSFTWGTTTLRGKSLGLVSVDALYSGLRVEPVPGAAAGTYRCIDPAARAQGCVPINPFDGYNAQEQAWLVRNGGLHSRSELHNGLAYLSGSLFELPAGPLQVALGAEARKIIAYENYTDEINRGEVTGNQISDSAKTVFKTEEFFVEGKAPILRDLPFVKELNVEAAYRWSDGHEAGKYETWKYGGDWSPVSGIRLRAMKNRAVRAPVLGEVTGVGETFGTVDDPCINYGLSSIANLRASCAALGIPADYNPPLTTIQNVGGFEGGNPDLKPEVADTLTYGFVLQMGQVDGTPSFLRNLTLSVDRFDIQIRDLISLLGRQRVAQLCYENAAGEREIFCSQLTRGTDPSVPGANYVLRAVDDLYQNIAELKLAGIDLQFNYSIPLEAIVGRDWGTLGLSSTWTFYDKARLTPYPGADPIDLLGSAGGDTADLSQGWIKDQSSTTLSWMGRRMSASWTTRYVGPAKSAPADVFGEESIVEIKARWYHDVQVRFSPVAKLELYAGINNVFDKAPPFFPSSQSGTQALDTIPAYYDIFGRQAYAGLKFTF
jgi:outer membrane receptor protein involved in Fe transport